LGSLLSHPAQRSSKRSGKASQKPLFEDFAKKWKDLWPAGVAILDGKGSLAGSWPDASAASETARAFALLKKEGQPIGQSYLFGYASDLKPKRQVALFVCGLAKRGTSKSTVLGGMLLARVPVDALVQPALADPLKRFFSSAKHGSFFLLQGSGRVAWVSPAGAESSGPALFTHALLGSMAGQDSGSQPAFFSGSKGLVVWARIFPWEGVQGPDALQVAAVFLPEADFSALVPPPALPHSPMGWTAWLWTLMAVLIPLTLALVMLGRTLGSVPLGEERVSSGPPEQKEEPEAPPQQVLYQEAGPSEFDGALREAREAKEALDGVARDLEQARARAVSLQAERDGLAEKIGAIESAQSGLVRQIENLKGELSTAEGAARQAHERELEARREAGQESGDRKGLEARISLLSASLDAKEKELQEALSRPSPPPVALQPSSPPAVPPSAPLGKGFESESVRLGAIQALSSELKATLSIIRKYVSEVVGSSGAISGPQQEFMGAVINKSARLERLVNDLQDLSQIQSAQTDESQVDLTALTEDLVTSAQAQAESKKLSLEFQAEAGLPAVSGDPKRLSQALNVLLNQAIKVTPLGGTVKVSLGLSGPDLELRVSDQGMPLDPDKAGMIFTAFHAADTEAGAELIGTGLRLPLVRAIAEAHGGSVKAEPLGSQGKAFVFRLPLAAPGAAAPAAPSPLEFKPSIFPALPKLGEVPVSLPSLPPLTGLPELPSASPKEEAVSTSSLSKDEFANFASIFGEGKGEAKAPVPPPSSPSPSASTLPPPPTFSPAPLASRPEVDLGKDEFANFASIFGEGKGEMKAPVPPPPSPSPSASTLPPPPAFSPAPLASRPQVDLGKDEMENFAAIFGDEGGQKTQTANPVPVSPPPPPKVKGLGTLDDLTSLIQNEGEPKPPKRGL
jgi:signal transduction histidine kinase